MTGDSDALHGGSQHPGAPENSGPTAAGLTDPATWVHNYGDSMYGFALVRLRDAGLAEEAVQETFLAALAAARSFAGRSSERTWLFGILKRKVVDTLRRRVRERPIGEGANDTPPDQVVDGLFRSRGSWDRPPGKWAPDPSDLAENAEFWQVFSECLDSLPERTAQAFSLRVMDGEDTEEACKILGISTNHLFVTLHRARTRLRQCLEANWFEPPEPQGTGEGRR